MATAPRTRVLGSVTDKPRVFRVRHGLSVLLLGSGTIKIGRRANCDYPLNDPKVSRDHARLIVSQQTMAIEDLGSANGVLLNGKPLLGLKRLETGDVFEIGNQTFEVLRPTEVNLEEESLVTVMSHLSTLLPPKPDAHRDHMPTRTGDDDVDPTR